MSNAQGGRPTKNERREQAREQARQLREQAQKRERRNRVFLQGGIILAVVAVLAVVAIVIVNSVKPAGPGPANMASGGILFVSDGSGGIKVASTPGLADGATPSPSTSTATVQIQEAIDLTCPVCNQFELGLRDSDGSAATAEELQSSGLTGDPTDYVGNFDYIKTLVTSGVASLELFPVAILDRSFEGSAYSTRSANALACIANAEPDSVLDFIEGMYQNQAEEGTSGLTDDQIIAIAKAANADTPDIESCIKQETYKSWVTSMTSTVANWGLDWEAPAQQTAADLAQIDPTHYTGAFGTPTIVVNGQTYAPTLPQNGQEVAIADSWASNPSFKTFVVQVGSQSSSTPTPSPTPTN